MGIVAGVEIQSTNDNFWGSVYPTASITEEITETVNGTQGGEIFVLILADNSAYSDYSCIGGIINLYSQNYTVYIYGGNLSGRHDIVVVTTEYFPYPRNIGYQVTTILETTTVSNTSVIPLCKMG